MRSPKQPRSTRTLTARKIGNWSGAIRFLQTLGKDVRRAALDEQYEQAKKLKRLVVGHILAQDLNWAPLAQSTLRNKNSYTRRMKYLDTETYLDSIKVWKEGDRAFAGVKKGKTYKGRSQKVMVDQVAIWLEYGTRTTPARPLWNPSIQEMGGARGIRDQIAYAIYRRAKYLSRGTPFKVTYSQIRSMFRANARTTEYGPTSD